ncbi:MAG: PH domain-containing protein [Phycisphaerales bacterium]|nr:PH domain-containing protein [Phycisphaerales bacterium]
MQPNQPPTAGPSGREGGDSESGAPATAVQAAARRADSADVTGPRDAAETDLWSGRTHWRHYAGRIALWAFGNLAAAILVGMLTSRVEWLTWVGATWTVLCLVIVSGIVNLGRVVLRVLGTYFRLTTQRLFIERGILSRTIDQTELIRVDDVRMQQSLLDRMFNVGNVMLLTTDATDRSVTIEGVKSPKEVAETVRNRRRALRGKSLFVENL